MRIALGASRLHLARQLTVEAALLALAGSGLGLVLAAQAIAAAMLWAPPSVPRLGEVSLDGTVALFVTAVTVVVTALLTAAPLGAIARTRTGETLREPGRSAIGRTIASGMSWSWARSRRRSSCCSRRSSSSRTCTGSRTCTPGSTRMASSRRACRFHRRIDRRTTWRVSTSGCRIDSTSSPGVEHVGVISVAPLSGLLATVPFSVAGVPHAERDAPSANLRAISPGYPSAVGTRLLEGRLFLETDRSNTPHVALVSAALAERFLSGAAVGQRLLIDDNNEGPRPIEIVGVLENVRHTALDLPAALDVYIPLRQVHPDGVPLLRNNQFWMIKTRVRPPAGAGDSAGYARSDPAAFRATFLEHLRAVDPDAAVSGTGAMRQVIDDWLGPRRFNLGLFGAFALTAVLLAVSGLYGLVSYAVGQRAPEIGLRMAIGATPRDVQWMILRQAAGLGVAGAVLGLCLAGAVWPLVSSMVPSTGLGTGPSAGHDLWISPAVVAATAALLVTVVLMAAWLPARRAARIEPALALKGQ